MHGQPELRSIGQIDLDQARDDVADQGGVPVEHGEVAFRRGQHNRGGAARDKGLLGRDNFHAEYIVRH